LESKGGCPIEKGLSGGKKRKLEGEGIRADFWEREGDVTDEPLNCTRSI